MTDSEECAEGLTVCVELPTYAAIVATIPHAIDGAYIGSDVGLELALVGVLNPPVAVAARHDREEATFEGCCVHGVGFCV